MSEKELTPEQEELQLLKQQAATLGITHSPNIKVETLKQKIAQKLSDEDDVPEEGEEVSAKVEEDFRTNLIMEATKLVRCRIMNMNPAKKDLQGEYWTVANGYIGTIRKFIAYGEYCGEDGYHVPQAILDHLKTVMFPQVVEKKGPNGRPIYSTRDVKEFAIEELPQISEKELETLARKQAAARGAD